MYLRFEGVVSDRSSKLGTMLLAVTVPKLAAAPKLLAAPVARIPTGGVSRHRQSFSLNCPHMYMYTDLRPAGSCHLSPLEVKGGRSQQG